MTKALVIPVEGPVEEIELAGDQSLEQLQRLVGGQIEALPVPHFVDQSGCSTSYINEDGKVECEPNMRATDFFVPGVGLFAGDYIAGPLVLCGFDPRTGTHRDLPETVERRVRLIEREAR